MNRLSRYGFAVLCVFLLVSLVAGCSSDSSTEPKKLVVTEVRFQANQPASVKVSASVTVTVDVFADQGLTGDDLAVTWTSSEPGKATAIGTGSVTGRASSATITGIAVGTVTITATSTFDATKSASITIEVTPGSVTGVGVTPPTADVIVGATTNLVATVTGDTGIDQSVTWSSADATVATVTSVNGTTGQVTGLKVGTVVVTAAAVADPTKTATATINVTSSGSITLVDVTPKDVTVNQGETRQMTATVSGTGTFSTAVTWSSGNESVATVNAAGLVTAVGVGSTSIIATSVQDPTKTGQTSITVQGSTITSVTVTPNAVTKKVGETQQFVAAVTGTGSFSDAVTWSSSNTSAATIDPSTGLATMVGAGSATISATSNQDNTKKGNAALTVDALDQATISISSITDQVGTVITGGTATGPITVNMQFDPKDETVSLLEILVDDVVVATQSFKPGKLEPEKAPTPASLGFDTSEIDLTAMGNTRFKNGAHAIKARITVGAATRSSATVTQTFSNADAFQGTLLGDGPGANDGGGNAWTSGNVTATVTPIIYTAGRRLTSVTVQFAAAFQATDNDTSGAAGSNAFSVTFAKSGALANYVTPAGQADLAQVIASTTANSGETGPFQGAGQFLGDANGILVDNQGPALPAVFQLKGGLVPVWLGSGYSFASGFVSAGDGVGVGIDRVEFFVSGGPLAGPTQVTTSTDLPSVSSINTYQLQSREYDKVGNVTTTVQAFNFGVDKDAPTLSMSAASVADRAIFAGVGLFSNFPAYNAASFFFTANAPSDGASGFATPATPITLSLVRTTSLSSVTLINNVLSGLSTEITSNTGVEGYYKATLFADDVAGNRSQTFTRDVLVDFTAPTPPVVQVNTGSVSAGQSFVVDLSTTDNIDLGFAEVAFFYAGGFLPYEFPGGQIPLNTAFSGTPVTSVSNKMQTIADPIVSVMEANGANQIGGPGGNITGLGVLSRDAAANTAVTFPALASTGATNWVASTWSVTSVSGAQVSRNGATAGVPTSVTLTAQHVIPSATPNAVDEVFQKIIFFRLLASGGFQAIGEGTLSGQQVNLNDKTFTYTFAWDPESDLLLGTNGVGGNEVIRAMGITGSHGAASQNAPIVLQVVN